MSTGAAVAVLSVAQRKVLAGLADALIPGGDGLPSASQADVHGKWIDRTFAARPDLVELVLSVISREGEPAAVLQGLRRESPAVFEEFAFAVAGTWLINPRVRKLLGYPGQAPKPKPAFPDESDFYLEGGVLDPVVQRGPIYRPTPAGGPAR